MGGMEGTGTRGQEGVHPSALLDRVLTWGLRGVQLRYLQVGRWAPRDVATVAGPQHCPSQADRA